MGASLASDAPTQTAMPIYQYLCSHCGHRFEQYRKPTQRNLSRCPQCRARARKLFRPVGIIFKGSGFHSTDYRKPEGKPAQSEKEPSASISDQPARPEKDSSG